MQSMQRRFGKFLPRSANEAQVGVLLKDFEDADKMLAKIIDASKAWRDSWRDILGTQQRLAHGFQTIYSPIIGANEEYTGHEPVATPHHVMERTTKFHADYDSLRIDLLEEVAMVDNRIIKPAQEAKDCIQPMKKVIKKRGDKKLDYEKYQARVDNGRKKTKRSERDNAALEKAETELIRAKDEYELADDHLKSTLPPVITAAFSVLPHLLAAQIMIQNTLLAQCYTVLHDFCSEESFPEPPHDASQILSTWDRDYNPIKRQVETGLACISKGKAVHAPMRIEEKPHGSVTGLNIRNGVSSQVHRRPSNQAAIEDRPHGSNGRNGVPQRLPSSQSNGLKPPSSPAISATSDPPSPESRDIGRPKISSTPSQTSLGLATPNYNSSALTSPSPGDSAVYAPAGPRPDYFSRDRLQSGSSMASIAAGKKKPPPPPPKKSLSAHASWVTALYEFTGEGQGDLSFKEGDRIKVVKKTESTDDWWEGELRGVQATADAYSGKRTTSSNSNQFCEEAHLYSFPIADMTDKGTELLKKPLYVFDLPPELLDTLQIKDSSIVRTPYADDGQKLPEKANNDTESAGDDTKISSTCHLCAASFPSVQEQRLHVKSDWHKYNLKQKIRGSAIVDETEFDRLVDELNESISGSGTDTSDSEIDGEDAKESTLITLLRKQARLSQENEEDESSSPQKRKRGGGKPPLLWLSSSLLPRNTSLGFYRGLFTNAEQNDSNPINVLRAKQLRPVPSKPPTDDRSNGVALPSTMTSPSIFLCMIGGGHFAGMIVSLAPKMAKHSTGTDQRQAIVLAHKTFHRYTTRRKQGGAQSANDSAKGAAHSAGSSLRRYNELALEQEIRALLAGWRDLINNAQLIFVRATGSSNRRILFGPYDDQILRQNDTRNRTFPFGTRRATQAELMRSFVELTRVKISEIDEKAILDAAAAAEAESTRSIPQAKPVQAPKPKPSKEEEEASLHTSQLQALIRRSKAPTLLSYLSSNALSANFDFFPPSAHANHHASTPLHLASSINSPVVVLALLTKAEADPSFPNGDGKPAFDLTGDRATRDAFRVARSELGESKWDWDAAHVPPALSKTEAEKRDAREKAENLKVESERRKAEEERLRQETSKVNDIVKKPGRALGEIPKTAEERRQEQARGMTPEMSMRVERERRARAAEERMKRMGQGAGR
ncbi:hypothetical protein ACLMJK_002956 [Lecanora helva]